MATSHCPRPGATPALWELVAQLDELHVDLTAAHYSLCATLARHASRITAAEQALPLMTGDALRNLDHLRAAARRLAGGAP